jgi:hypothetical protein
MEQKCYILDLFWLQMTIFMTNEGCLGLENDYMSKKYANFGLKKDLFWLQKLKMSI